MWASRIQGYHMLARTIPAAFPQFSAGMQDKRKGFDTREPHLPEMLKRVHRLYDLQQDYTPADEIRWIPQVSYKGPVEQDGGRAFLFKDDPAAACVGIFWIDECIPSAGIDLWLQSCTPGYIFIPVGSEIESPGYGNKGHRAHAARYLRVDMATPNSSGKAILETLATPIRSSAI